MKHLGLQFTLRSVGMALLMISLTGSPAPAQEQLLRLSAVSSCEDACITQPGDSAQLIVTAQNQAGGGVPDIPIVFVAPMEGAGGTFPQSVEVSQTIQRVTTDANGIAEVTFVTNDTPGVFLVEAFVETAFATRSFAFTNGVDQPAPAGDADAVRATILTSILDDAVLNHEVQLHGPVLLPAGTQILSGPVSDPILGGRPVAVDKQSWLLWIDDAPIAPFEHGARWVLVDAALEADEIAANATVIFETWWPSVVLPGTPTAFSLYPPGPSNAFITAVLTDEPAGQAFVFRSADSDGACAILIYGPDLPGARNDTEKFRDYLLRNGLVAADKIFMNLQATDGGRFLVNVPVSRSRLKLQIARAKDAGCTKLHWVFATHGSRGTSGGGVTIRGESPGDPNGFLTYEEMVRCLSELGQIELCMIQGSCFSGQLSSWIQGLGFTGQIITAADSQNVGWTQNSGGILLDCLIKVLEREEINTYQEAMVYIRTNKTEFGMQNGTRVDYLNDPRPTAAPISATGTRQMFSTGIMIPEPSYRRIIRVRRPDGVDPNATFTARLQINDSGIATADKNEVTLGPGVNSGRFLVRGEDCGSTTYTLRGRDESTGANFITSNTIEVGSFTLSQMTITLQPNTRGTITLTRFGSALRLGNPAADTSTEIKVESKDTMIAEPGLLFPIPMTSGQTTLEFGIWGRKPGRTLVEVTDMLTGNTKTIVVIVPGPPPPPAGSACPSIPETTKEVSLPVKDDRHNHKGFVNMPSKVELRIATSNGALHIGGPSSQTVDAVGNWDCERGIGSAIGNSGSTRIANFSNVTGRYDLKLSLSFSPNGPNTTLDRRAATAPATATITYTLGAGAFPNGPIIYEGTVTLDVEGGGGCTYEVSQEAERVDFDGDRRLAVISTQPGCPWSATATESWITFPAGSAGAGPAALEYEVAGHEGQGTRTAEIAIAGELLGVMQDGADSLRPVVFSIANGASFELGIASATWITIQGANLAPATRTWADGDFSGANLPMSLDGVSVTVNGRPAFVFFISPGQLNVLAPDDENLGLIQVVVTTPEGASDPYDFYRQQLNPALFLFTQDPVRYPAAVRADGPLLGKVGLIPGANTIPALPGDSVLLFGTGFGPTNPPTPTGQLVTQATPLATSVVVRIGGLLTEVQFAGLTGSGLYQFNLVVPNLPPGDHLIEIFVNGMPIQESVYLTVGE